MISRVQKHALTTTAAQGSCTHQDASPVEPFTLRSWELPSSSCLSSLSLSLSLPSSSDVKLTSYSMSSSAARGDSTPAQLSHLTHLQQAEPLPSSAVLQLLLLRRCPLLSLLSLLSDCVRLRGAVLMLLYELRMLSQTAQLGMHAYRKGAHTRLGQIKQPCKPMCLLSWGAQAPGCLTAESGDS